MEQVHNTYVQHDLVQKLQHIAAEHVGQQPPIDLAAQSHQIHVGVHITMALEIHHRLVMSIGAHHMGPGFWMFLTHLDRTKSSDRENKQRNKREKCENKRYPNKIHKKQKRNETTITKFKENK
jgi:hypothetical protein